MMRYDYFSHKENASLNDMSTIIHIINHNILKYKVICDGFMQYSLSVMKLLLSRVYILLSTSKLLGEMPGKVLCILLIHAQRVV